MLPAAIFGMWNFLVCCVTFGFAVVCFGLFVSDRFQGKSTLKNLWNDLNDIFLSWTRKT